MVDVPLDVRQLALEAAVADVLDVKDAVQVARLLAKANVIKLVVLHV